MDPFGNYDLNDNYDQDLDSRLEAALNELSGEGDRVLDNTAADAANFLNNLDNNEDDEQEQHGSLPKRSNDGLLRDLFRELLESIITGT